MTPMDRIFIITDDALEGDKAKLLLAKAGYDTEDGYIIWSPPGERHFMDWMDFFRVDMQACVGVAVLPNWRNSPGANFELGVAFVLGMKVRPLACWLDSHTKCTTECWN